jgi:hypothetical protein
VKVKDALAKAFVAEGGTGLFGMMGGANIYDMDRPRPAIQ